MRCAEQETDMTDPIDAQAHAATTGQNSAEAYGVKAVMMTANKPNPE